MAIVTVKKFDLNKFWEQTPTVLKYILLISLIVAGSYFLFSRKINNNQIKELDKIEQVIETSYTLINRFEEFERNQYTYNEEIMSYLKNIYILVNELNENTNKKFNILLKTGGENTDNIIDKLVLLNESFEKLQKAYTPEKIETPIKIPKQTISIGVTQKLFGDTLK